MVDEVVTPQADPVVTPAAVENAPVVEGKTPAPLAEAKTLLASDESPDVSEIKGKWPDDWREQLAGGDEKLLGTLKRYTSPANYAKAGWEAQQKIRTGEYKRSALPADAKPEDVAAWRKENGLPETKDAYAFDLGGYVPGENAAPVLEAFRDVAFSENLPPATANKLASWYFAQEEAAIAKQALEDNKFRFETAVELKGEWGPEYTANINGVKNYLVATAPEGFAEQIMSARLPSGKLLGDDPLAIKWLAERAREEMPSAALMPAGTSNPGKGAEARLAELNAMQNTREGYDAYWRSAELQNEYQRLNEAVHRMKSRAA